MSTDIGFSRRRPESASSSIRISRVPYEKSKGLSERHTPVITYEESRKVSGPYDSSRSWGGSRVKERQCEDFLPPSIAHVDEASSCGDSLGFQSTSATRIWALRDPNLTIDLLASSPSQVPVAEVSIRSGESFYNLTTPVTSLPLRHIRATIRSDHRGPVPCNPSFTPNYVLELAQHLNSGNASQGYQT